MTTPALPLLGAAFAVAQGASDAIENVVPFGGLLPLGGASALLIYMIRIIVVERRSWIAEREQLKQDMVQLTEQHRAEIAEKRQQRLDERATLITEHNAAMKAAVADLEHNNAWLRQRVEQCEVELAELRGRKDGPSR